MSPNKMNGGKVNYNNKVSIPRDNRFKTLFRNKKK